MSKYKVTLECHTLVKIEVEADNKAQAVEEALKNGRGNCFGDSMEFYEIEKLDE